jgi:hypothetical protein
VVSWLAAAKYIKKCTIPPSQQRLWWTLLAACTSINIYLMILDGLWKNFWYALAPLLLIPLAAIGYMYLYSQQLVGNNDQEVHKVTLKELCQVFFSIKSYKFWFVVVLNILLVVTKWVIILMLPCST